MEETRALASTTSTKMHVVMVAWRSVVLVARSCLVLRSPIFLFLHVRDMLMLMQVDVPGARPEREARADVPLSIVRSEGGEGGRLDVVLMYFYYLPKTINSNN